MSRVLQRGISGPSLVNNNRTDNRIYGHGNTIINHNRSINIVTFSGVHEIPRITIENVLGEHHVPGAAFAAQTDSGCMQGTRVQFLNNVLAVLKARSRPRIAWVSGMAGTGKTSISVTLCQLLGSDDSVCLGGAFFCSRSAGSIERTDVRRIIPTLAVTFARQFPDYASALAEQLEKEPEIAHCSIRMQVEFLLKQPLETLAPLGGQIVFVIDALDECSDHIKLAELLSSLANFGGNSQVKFMVTSRPELHLRESPINDPKLSSIFGMHSIDQEQVTEDIRLYVSSSLEQMSPTVPWYGASDVDALVQLSAGLFIFAATVIRYIRDERTVKKRRERLRKATSAANPSQAVIAPIDKIYEFILTEASRSDHFQDDGTPTTQHVLACVLRARVSVSVEVLAKLIDVEAEDLRGRLDRLHSVVYLPADNSTPGVRTLHASFGDYLLDRAPGDLRIAHSIGDDILARGCLRVMAKQLRFNISMCHSSYERNPPIQSKAITNPMEYACLQWIYHLASLPEPSALDETVEMVFRPGFLFWLEILSIMGHVRRAAAMLIVAAATVKRPELARFLRDANVFVASSHVAIERSAPHIYLSAVPFAAKDSLIYQDFYQKCEGVISVHTSGITRHGGRLVMRLSGHEGSIEAVAHSFDGQLLVSASRDGTARIWDMRTGDQATLSLPGSVTCHSVAFAPDGKHIVSGTESGVIHVWDLVQGVEVMNPLSGHSAAVLSVAFSPDGRLIASASADRTVRLWEAATGFTSIVLTGHKGWVRAVAFSSDGEFLVSGSDDRTTRLWHVKTGEPASQPLCASDMGISSVCFSPDGAQIASSSYDGNIQLWAWVWPRAEHLATLLGHSDSVNCIRFSPDGYSLVSVSSDMTLRLWDLRGGPSDISSVVLGSHAEPINAVSYSPDGLYIASASGDGIIRMWHAIGSHLELQPQQTHTAGVNSVAVSPDGALIVSGSVDRSIRIWNLQTGLPKLVPLLGHEGDVYSVDISSDGRMIASGSADRTIRMWNPQTSRAIGAPRRSQREIQQVAFSPNNEWLASASADGTVSIWNTASWLPASSGPLRCIRAPAEHQPNPTVKPFSLTISVSPNGCHLAVGTSEPSVQLWDAVIAQPNDSQLATNTDIIADLPDKVFRLPESELRLIANQLSKTSLRGVVDHLNKSTLHAVLRDLPDSSVRAAVCQLSHPQLCDALRGLPAQTLRDAWLKSPIPAWNTFQDHMVLTSLSPLVDNLSHRGIQSVVGKLPVAELRATISRRPESDHRFLVSRVPERDLHMIVDQLPYPELLDVFSQLPRPDICTAVGELPQSDLNNILSLWLEGTKCVSFAPNGSKIVSGVENGSIYVWDMDIRSQAIAFSGHTESVSAVAWSPHEQFIASGSEDATVRLWDAGSAKLISTLYGHTQGVRSVVFTPDGRFIVSGGDDGTIRVWDVNAATADDPFRALFGARRENGWFIGSSGELLLWVPREYEDNLVIGRRCANLIATHKVSLSVDKGGICGGVDWTKCWKGPTGLQPLSRAVSQALHKS